MTTPENAKLLPCPFCGGTDVHVINPAPGATGRYVACEGCMVEGPWAAGEDASRKAADLWNRAPR
jgi:Lar family restriction alleviation protein